MNNRAIVRENGEGVAIGMPNNIIGGTTIEARNVISGNNDNGIIIYANEILVQGNFIGTDVTGTLTLGNGNSGVWIENGSNNIIGGLEENHGNIIAYNAGNGLSVIGGAGNSILSNA